MREIRTAFVCEMPLIGFLSNKLHVSPIHTVCMLILIANEEQFCSPLPFLTEKFELVLISRNAISFHVSFTL